jgi:phosphoenolpyruvate---glycerone phosphotransferase subunit DhaL
MSITPALMPEIIAAIDAQISEHADTITALDQAIGDGDHVFNLQRGLQALQTVSNDISTLDWPAAWQKIGMTVMAAIGGASGSLYATLFISLHKHSRELGTDISAFANAFALAIDAVKQRGKADVGEKTMLDVWVPVAQTLQRDVTQALTLKDILDHVSDVANAGVESTRDMLATKGRASFLGERSLGHIDAGAKTAALIVEAITKVIKAHI